MNAMQKDWVWEPKTLHSPLRELLTLKLNPGQKVNQRLLVAQVSARLVQQANEEKVSLNQLVNQFPELEEVAQEPLADVLERLVWEEAMMLDWDKEDLTPKPGELPEQLNLRDNVGNLLRPRE